MKTEPTFIVPNSKSYIKNSVDFVILLSHFIIKNFRGTYSSVKMLKMLKGYMVRKSFGKKKC